MLSDEVSAKVVTNCLVIFGRIWPFFSYRKPEQRMSCVRIIPTRAATDGSEYTRNLGVPSALPLAIMLDAIELLTTSLHDD